MYQILAGFEYAFVSCSIFCQESTNTRQESLLTSICSMVYDFLQFGMQSPLVGGISSVNLLVSFEVV